MKIRNTTWALPVKEEEEREEKKKAKKFTIEPATHLDENREQAVQLPRIRSVVGNDPGGGARVRFALARVQRRLARRAAKVRGDDVV